MFSRLLLKAALPLPGLPRQKPHKCTLQVLEPAAQSHPRESGLGMGHANDCRTGGQGKPLWGGDWA